MKRYLNNDIVYTRYNGFHSHRKINFSFRKPYFFEECWSYSNDMGWGRFKKVEIRPGFEIWLTECLFHEKIVFSFADKDPLLAFSFILSGNSNSRMKYDNRKLRIKGGHQGVFYYPNPMGAGFFETGIPVRQIGIVIDPDKLLYYFEYDPDNVPLVLRRIIVENNNDLFIDINNISPAMYETANQLMDCPLQGIARKLFLESRALELIALQLDQTAAPEDHPAGGMIARSMHPQDKKQTDYVKDLLLSDLENPPGLKELSKAAGMSHPKLNRCFQKAYGMTVFQYLRFERLNKAREMLVNSGLSVTEAAYSVGYSSLSHFAKAYKEQFGILPGGSRKA